MKTKNGICPYCGHKRGNRFGVFEVPYEQKEMICPRCGKTIKTSEAIQALDNLIFKQLLKAKSTLTIRKNPIVAYGQFAEVFKYDDNNLDAHFGRILCVFYNSKLRVSCLEQAQALLEERATDVFHKTERKHDYLLFLSKLNFCLDNYLKLIKKKLTYKSFYFEGDCIALYLTHLNEVISFKKLLKDEADFITRHSKSEKSDVLSCSLAQSIEDMQSQLRYEYRTVEGKKFVLDRIKRTGECVVIDANADFVTPLSKYKMSTLNPQNSDKKVINDKIFKKILL